jgi:hypothetical protein
MHINKISNKILTNKYMLKGLEKISEHGTTFAAATSLVLSVGLRPFSIYKTPDVKEENKFYAMANSISSGLIKFAMVEAIALPIENAVKRIDKNSDKYLKKTNLKSNTRSYKFITQTMKLSAGLLVAIPKSIMTVALIPVIMDKLFLKTKAIPSIYDNLSKNKKDKKVNKQQTPEIQKLNEEPSFTGNYGEKLSKGLARIIDNKRIQNLAKKYQFKDEDIFKNITAMTDVLLASTSVYQTNKSKNIHENSKKALIYNNIISTVVTVIGGYWVDSTVKNKTAKFVEVFKEANKNDPKLLKYVEGINIIRPALIFAGIYYGILPIFSTYFSDKIDRFIQERKLSALISSNNKNLHKD